MPTFRSFPRRISRPFLESSPEFKLIFVSFAFALLLPPNAVTIHLTRRFSAPINKKHSECGASATQPTLEFRLRCRVRRATSSAVRPRLGVHYRLCEDLDGTGTVASFNWPGIVVYLGGLNLEKLWAWTALLVEGC